MQSRFQVTEFQVQMFDTTPENVLMHLRNICKSKELVEQATTKNFLVVRQEWRGRYSCSRSQRWTRTEA